MSKTNTVSKKAFQGSAAEKKIAKTWPEIIQLQLFWLIPIYLQYCQVHWVKGLITIKHQQVYFLKVYLSKVYFCKMYPTCVSSKLCEFIQYFQKLPYHYQHFQKVLI